MSGACDTCGGQKRCIQGFGRGTAHERIQLGRLRSSWENNIAMVLEEVGWGGMDWITLAHDREGWRAVVNAVMNLRVT